MPDAGTVAEAISKSALQRYIRGFNKARNLFEQAILKADNAEAIKQKQAQMINHALLAEVGAVVPPHNSRRLALLAIRHCAKQSTR